MYSGYSYQGHYENGIKSGRGTLYYDNREVKSGQWEFGSAISLDKNIALLLEAESGYSEIT